MEAEKYEHRKALKSDLSTFWVWLQGQLTEDAKARGALLITELNGLLRDRGEDFSWIEAIRAELLMLPLLPEPALDSQMRRRLDQAQREGTISPERYAEAIKRFFDKDAPASLEVKREGYRALLTELHQYFLNRRFRRDQRSETARVLKWFTIWILVLALLPIVAFSLIEPLTDGWFTPKYLMQSLLFCTAAAGLFGILGAFFSRLVSFQSRLQAFGFEQLLNAFSAQFIVVRCAMGMFGAVIFYFLMRSGLLGGTLFLEELKFEDDSAKFVANFAKLIVWSFIAGWSERLVPETLERTERSAKSSEANKPPAA